MSQTDTEKVDTAEDIAAATELVRAVEANGAKVSISRTAAEAGNLKILDESPYNAVSGQVLGPIFPGEDGYDIVEDVEPTSPEGIEELKGAALDQALDDAGLVKSGTVAEKRARLTEHAANQTPGAAGSGDQQ